MNANTVGDCPDCPDWCVNCGKAKGSLNARMPLKSNILTHEEFMAKVREMAPENMVIATLLKHKGEPSEWPEHLREDLYRRLNLKPVTVYEVRK